MLPRGSRGDVLGNVAQAACECGLVGVRVRSKVGRVSRESPPDSAVHGRREARLRAFLRGLRVLRPTASGPMYRFRWCPAGLEAAQR